MSIEAAIEALTAAVQENTAEMKVMNAGREAALAQLTDAAASGTPKPASRSRKKAEAEAPAATDAGNGASAPSTAAASDAAAPSPTATTPEVTEDDLRNAAQTYIAGAGQDAAARAERGGQIKAITTHFGTATLVGETGINGADERKQALFFLRRLNEGLPVNFSHDYDFDGDVTQDDGAPATAGGDDFNIG